MLDMVTRTGELSARGRFAGAAFRGQDVAEVAMRFRKTGPDAHCFLNFRLGAIDCAGCEQQQP